MRLNLLDYAKDRKIFLKHFIILVVPCQMCILFLYQISTKCLLLLPLFIFFIVPWLSFLFFVSFLLPEKFSSKAKLRQLWDNTLHSASLCSLDLECNLNYFMGGISRRQHSPVETQVLFRLSQNGAEKSMN